MSGGSSWAVRADGSVVAWGLKNALLGLGSGVDRIFAPTVIPELAGVRSLSHGPDHACANTTDGKAVCWGRGGFGQLGTVGFEAFNRLLFAPTHLPDFGAGIVRIATGRNHTCMVFASEIRCAGANAAGQLGIGTTSSHSVAPVTVVWPL